MISPAGANETFDITATFNKGNLKSLSGQGNPGFIPYSKSKSTSTFCGAANSYSSTGSTITKATKAPAGYAWEFIIKAKNTSGYGWFKVTVKGNWTSSTEAKTVIRFLEPKMPDKGKCDSGPLSVTLKKS